MADSPAPRKPRRRTTRRVVRTASTLLDGDRPRRGRPPGSKNKRAAAAAPVASLARRIQALVKENDELRAQVRELESAFRKIESALGGNVTRTRRAGPAGGKRRGRPPQSTEPIPEP